MRVRNIRCPTCGAPRLTPTRSAYVYCDFCARYMDYDVNAAKYTAGIAAGPHYRGLVAQLADELAAARAAGDREALLEYHRALVGRYMSDCANAYSPRLADPAYREATLARAAHVQTVRDLDVRCRAADAELAVAAEAIDMDVVGDGTQYRVTSARAFWRMYDAYLASAAALAAALATTPPPVADPDDPPPELEARQRDSTFVQGWIAALDDEVTHELLVRTGLTAEYVELPDPALHAAACQHCGAAREAPEGALRTVCEACGLVTTLGRSGPCASCGGAIDFPLGRTLATCPHCQARARLMEL
jgi:hypothetical protein